MEKFKVGDRVKFTEEFCKEWDHAQNYGTIISFDCIDCNDWSERVVVQFDGEKDVWQPKTKLLEKITKLHKALM